MSPEEQADRLFNRVMRYSSEGKADSAAFFAPMALASIEALAPLDAHRRYDLGLVALTAGDVARAGAQGDTILAQRPTHLLGLMLAARVEKGLWPDALIWDMGDPYHYARLDPHEAHDTIIFGGRDHKTGQAPDTRDRFTQLEQALRLWMPGADVTHRWSGQIIETRDGLPYIGETSPRQFTITGFGGNGITFGTLGAMMARDAATGRSNPWAALYDVGRTRVAQGLWDYLKENKDYPYYMVRDRFAGAEGRSLRAVPCGDGRIIDLRGSRIAAYRDAQGRFSLLSPICPHMGCQVAWNSAESTWDCPCHGSRFSATGAVMGGPAEQGLKSLEADRNDAH